MIISRATDTPIVEGRTLIGRAYRYDHPSKVTDDGWRTSYLEELAKACDAKSLHDRASFPVGLWHPWTSNAGRMPAEPFGVVRFSTSTTEQALMFEATISRTALGNDMLELVADHALEDVSITYKPIRTRTRTTAAGPVTSRVEVALRELSLAPPGFGLHDDAKVLAMRAAEEDPGTPRLDRYRRRGLLL